MAALSTFALATLATAATAQAYTSKRGADRAKQTGREQKASALKLTEDEERKRKQTSSLLQKRRGATKERKGRESILTSPLGLTTPAATAGKTALGL